MRTIVKVDIQILITYKVRVLYTGQREYIRNGNMESRLEHRSMSTGRVTQECDVGTGTGTGTGTGKDRNRNRTRTIL